MNGAELDANPLLACVDVDYRRDMAVAAAAWFRGWRASTAEKEATATINDVAAYKPGEFYRRELPCLLAVLARGPRPDVVLVDGYVWLENRRPGLGQHLYDALKGEVAVIGVAKTEYAGVPAVIEVCRGTSRSPLYVTSAGIDTAKAATWISEMHGSYRIPTLLKRVDSIARRGI